MDEENEEWEKEKEFLDCWNLRTPTFHSVVSITALTARQNNSEGNACLLRHQKMDMTSFFSIFCHGYNNVNMQSENALFSNFARGLRLRSWFPFSLHRQDSLFKRTTLVIKSNVSKKIPKKCNKKNTWNSLSTRSFVSVCTWRDELIKIFIAGI